MGKSRGGSRRGRGRGGGGGNGRDNGQGKSKSKGRDVWASSERQSYQDIVKENKLFEKYYHELGLMSGEEETAEFWSTLRRELPNSFRFCGSKGHAAAVQKKMSDKYIPEITSLTYNEAAVAPPEPIPWYPNNLAWSMTTPKQVLRRFPPLAAFQKFLVSETAVGSISRQEAVSMIPPLLLDIQPHHVVLDLCAAPGSKSAQLVEMLHAGEEDRTRAFLANKEKASGAQSNGSSGTINDSIDQGRSTGLLVANDMNYSRAQMLVHQLKRLNSPNLIVMNHDATLFPSIALQPTTHNGTTRNSWLKFDRILADVPCSGDGTCRKNPAIWKEWAPANSLGLYITQVRILVRTLQMLKVGGRAVYSTCSMNPMENEAVISSAIDRCGGPDKVSIVNVSAELPQLKRVPGLKDWKIMDKEGRVWNNWTDVADAKAKQDEPSLARLVEGMFPAMGSHLSLENCVRVYPHLQDTGGFFITVLEKKSEIKAKPESAAKKTNNVPSVVSLVKEIETTPLDAGIIPFLGETDIAPSNVDHDDLINRGNTSAAARQNKTELPDVDPGSLKRSIDDAGDPGDAPTTAIKRARTEKDDADIGGVSETAQIEHYPPPPANQLTAAAEETMQPKLPKGTLRQLSKHEEAFKYLDQDHPELEYIRKFYEVSPEFPQDRFMVRNASGAPVKSIYYTTALGKEILVNNEGKGMKFVHGGVKMFVKQESHGSDVCRWRIQSEGLPLIEGWIGRSRFVRLRKRETMRTLLREMFPKISGDCWKDLAEVGEQVKDMSMGCAILEIEPSGEEGGFEERMVLPLWRGVASLNLMLPKEERKALLLRLFDDDCDLIDHSHIKRNGDEASAKEDTKGEAQLKATNGEQVPSVASAHAAEAAGLEADVAVNEDRAEEAMTTKPEA